jgi:hypothetical protein
MVFTDDNTGWLQFGEINRYADKAIAEGTIPPMIIVMPNGDSSFPISTLMMVKKSMRIFLSKNSCLQSKKRTGSKQTRNTGALLAFQWVAMVP